MGNSTGKAAKTSTKTGQKDKTKERRWNRWKQKGKGNTRKIPVKHEEINQKVHVKEGKLKRYRQRLKQYRQNRTFQNNERKFYQQLGGDDTKKYQQPDGCKKKNPNDFGLKYGNQKRQQKGRMDKQYGKRIRKTQRSPENGNTHRFTQNDTKNISNWKTPGHNRIHGLWFKKFTSIHDRLALEMN